MINSIKVKITLEQLIEGVKKGFPTEALQKHETSKYTFEQGFQMGFECALDTLLLTVKDLEGNND